MKRNGENNRITLINKSSTDAIRDGDVDFVPEIIFTEAIDCGIVGEGFPIIARDIASIAGDQTVVLPDKIKQFGYMIECDCIYRTNAVEDVMGFDMRPLNVYSRRTYFPIRANLFRARCLSAIHRMHTYSYRCTAPDTTIVEIEARGAGLCHGSAIWALEAPYIAAAAKVSRLAVICPVSFAPNTRESGSTSQGYGAVLVSGRAGARPRLNNRSKPMTSFASVTRSCARMRVSRHPLIIANSAGNTTLLAKKGDRFLCAGKRGSMISKDKIAGTKSASASRHGLARRAVSHHLIVELNETAKLAWPMMLTQLGQVAMMTTDLAFIGRTGAESVAAVALAGRVYLISVISGMGLLAAIAPVAAQAFAADKLAVVRRSLQMGLWAALFLSLPTMAFALRGEQILVALGQAPDAAQLAQQYLFGLAWGVAPALWFHAIRNFMAAVNRPEPVLWITLTAVPINGLLIYLLIFGKLGLPRLGLFGAGLATTVVNCGTFAAGLWFATMRRPFRDYHVLAHLWRFDWPLMRQLIVIGTPISIASLIEYGLFSVAALLAGIISTSALAAHQIAFQVNVILLTIYFGISMAAAVRVGYAVGRDDGLRIKRAGLAAMLLGLVIATMLTLAVIVARFEIAGFFLTESAHDGAATIAVAAKLLLVGATFFITDCVANIAAGGLRGLKDTRVPLVFAGAYWLVGFSFSYGLGLKSGLGIVGIWIGLSIATTVYAALLLLRFQLLASRLALPTRHPTT